MVASIRFVGLGEFLTGCLWRLIPQAIRLKLAQRIDRLQQRALRSIPRSEVLIMQNQPNITSLRLPKYTLITTVINEESSIVQWLDSVFQQTVKPEEVIICDGGSTDKTIDTISKFSFSHPELKISILSLPGANISAGRNHAIRRSKTEIVLLSDAGCVLDRRWAELLLSPFAENEQVDVVMGFYKPLLTTALQRAIAYFIVPQKKTIDPELFLPSARSLGLKRSVWQRAGEFPEYLTLAGEDSLFDYYLKSTGAMLAFVPDAEVLWLFPKSIKAIFKMIYRYARGDAEGGKVFWGHYLWLLKQLGFFVVELSLASAITFLYLKSGGSFLFLLLVFAGVFPVMRIIRIGRAYRPYSSLDGDLSGLLFRPLGLAVVIIAQVAGFIRGMFSYRFVQMARMRGAENGCLALFTKEPIVFEQTKNQQDLLSSALERGFYVVNIYANSQNNKHILFDHPHFEAYQGEHFQSEIWLKKQAALCPGFERKFFFHEEDQIPAFKMVINAFCSSGATTFRSIENPIH